MTIITHITVIASGCAFVLANSFAQAQPFPSAGPPNPAMIDPVQPASPPAVVREPPRAPAQAIAPAPPPAAVPPSQAAVAPVPVAPAAGSVPRAVAVARATDIPRCTMFVDAAAPARGAGTVQSPHKTIGAAVAAAPPGAVICVAEGIYPEQVKPDEKFFTLAGGFQRGQDFRVRDSARFVSKAQGRGGSFFLSENEGPKKNQLTAIDGFEITGYARAVVRDVYYSQRFDLTNNNIHGNRCPDSQDRIVGAGFALNNISGRIEGNVFRNNICGRGGAGALNDSVKENTVTIARNLVDNNAGTEPGESHGGAFYFFGKTLRVVANLFTNNKVTGWGAGLYIGAYPPDGSFTNASMSWNVYRGNRANIAGGGMFCDDGASCTSSHEIYDRNCGGNVYVDGGNANNDPTVSRFDYITVVGALDPECKGPGPGFRADGSNLGAPDNHTVTNALFWNNGPDIAAGCDNCGKVRVTVSHSMVDPNHISNNLKVTFGPGNIAPTDPLFADAASGDFHLKSAAGRWTPTGYVQDQTMSPAIAKADPRAGADQNPQRTGGRSELGAFGNSLEASFTR